VIASRITSGFPPQEHIGNRDRKQDYQRFSAREQVFQAGIDTDGGKEVHQQHIARGQVEIYFDAACKKQQCDQQCT